MDADLARTVMTTTGAYSDVLTSSALSVAYTEPLHDDQQDCRRLTEEQRRGVITRHAGAD